MHYLWLAGPHSLSYFLQTLAFLLINGCFPIPLPGTLFEQAVSNDLSL